MLEAKGLIADLDQVATAEPVRCGDALTIDQRAVCAPQIVENKVSPFAADLGMATRCACTGNHNRVIRVASKRTWSVGERKLLPGLRAADRNKVCWHDSSVLVMLQPYPDCLIRTTICRGCAVRS